MADISKIKLPNGTTYDLKDSTTRHVATYSNSNGSNDGKYYKISINSYNSWMLLFKIYAYHRYESYEFAISGYNYGTSHWYSPAVMMLTSSYYRTIDFTFGYDSDWHLWVAFPAAQYSGIAVSLEANGYAQVTDEKNLFTIELVEGIPETAQTTKSCVRPWYRDETVSNAANATTAASASSLKHSAALNADTIDSFHPADLAYADVSSLSGIGLGGNDGILIWIPWSARYGRQIIFDDTSHTILSRAYSNGTWSAWKDLSDANKVNGHTVNSDVPSNAKFTDTTISMSMDTTDTKKLIISLT